MVKLLKIKPSHRSPDFFFFFLDCCDDEDDEEGAPPLPLPFPLLAVSVFSFDSDADSIWRSPSTDPASELALAGKSHMTSTLRGGCS